MVVSTKQLTPFWILKLVPITTPAEGKHFFTSNTVLLLLLTCQDKNPLAQRNYDYNQYLSISQLALVLLFYYS